MSWYQGPVFDRLGLDWRSHKIAAWCLAKLWLQPAQVGAYLKSIPPSRRLGASSLLLLLNLPYIMLIFLACAVSFHLFLPHGLSLRAQLRVLHNERGRFAVAMSVIGDCVLINVLGGLVRAVWFLIPKEKRGIFTGSTVVAFLIMMVTLYIRIELPFPQFVGAGVMALAAGITAAIALEAGVIAPFFLLGALCGAVFFSLGSSVVFAIPGRMWMLWVSVFLLGLHGFALLIHPFFVWPKVRGDRYLLHPMAWDDMIVLPFFPRMERLLVDFAQRNPGRAAVEFQRLKECQSEQWSDFEDVLQQARERIVQER